MLLSQLTEFCGGFTLCGYRQKNGKLKPVSSSGLIDDWPKEVSLGLATYTLEEVNKSENGFEEAEYV